MNLKEIEKYRETRSREAALAAQRRLIEDRAIERHVERWGGEMALGLLSRERFGRLLFNERLDICMLIDSLVSCPENGRLGKVYKQSVIDSINSRTRIIQTPQLGLFLVGIRTTTYSRRESESEYSLSYVIPDKEAPESYGLWQPEECIVLCQHELTLDYAEQGELYELPRASSIKELATVICVQAGVDVVSI